MKNYVVYIVVLVIGGVLGYGFASWTRPEVPESESPSSIRGRISEGTVLGAPSDSATFSHARLGFSLSYPNEFSVTEFDEGEGARTIVFQKPGEQTGFQLFIVPYEETTISAERIRRDIPSGVVEDSVEAIIGDGIRATIFWSTSPTIGKTREAWFIHDGYLYEATTYAALDQLLGDVLATIDFK